ncbi:helix-turn-helix domain-containing protein [Parathalassolituus penaei]|uniref:Helix-turn-helix transcriptional regulator n=1 Tax=Parathalassolituus penaei TaxID=2997323 RepID=A0A9X3EHA2_9GAMM|nr:helix-turn-helix transcriptional regulator [Parathalassolituus penaei]MCY0966724.1 helix-turn-helix transcriptional regulator [Parathalassolituus penaei]
MSYQQLSVSALIAEVGHRVRAARLAKNLSQEELARASAVSRSTIKRLESGGDSISLGNLLTVLQVLDQVNPFIESLPEHKGAKQRASKPRSSGA